MYVRGKPTHPSLMFARKAGACPLRSFPSRVNSHKHKTRLETPSTDKHSSFLRIFINYWHKKFYKLPWGYADDEYVGPYLGIAGEYISINSFFAKWIIYSIHGISSQEVLNINIPCANVIKLFTVVIYCNLKVIL